MTTATVFRGSSEMDGEVYPDAQLRDRLSQLRVKLTSQSLTPPRTRQQERRSVPYVETAMRGPIVQDQRYSAPAQPFPQAATDYGSGGAAVTYSPVRTNYGQDSAPRSDARRHQGFRYSSSAIGESAWERRGSDMGSNSKLGWANDNGAWEPQEVLGNQWTAKPGRPKQLEEEYNPDSEYHRALTGPIRHYSSTEDVDIDIDAERLHRDPNRGYIDARQCRVIWRDGQLGLGLEERRVAGNIVIRVSKFHSESVGSHSKDLQRLSVGDVLVEINGQSVTGQRLRQVAQLLQNIRRPVELGFIATALFDDSADQHEAALLRNPQRHLPTAGGLAPASLSSRSSGSPMSWQTSNFSEGEPEIIEQQRVGGLYQIYWENPPKPLGLIFKKGPGGRVVVARIPNANLQPGANLAEVGDTLERVGEVSCRHLGLEECVELLRAARGPTVLELCHISDQQEPNRYGATEQPTTIPRPALLTTRQLGSSSRRGPTPPSPPLPPPTAAIQRAGALRGYF